MHDDFDDPATTSYSYTAPPAVLSYGRNIQPHLLSPSQSSVGPSAPQDLFTSAPLVEQPQPPFPPQMSSGYYPASAGVAEGVQQPDAPYGNVYEQYAGEANVEVECSSSVSYAVQVDLQQPYHDDGAWPHTGGPHPTALYGGRYLARLPADSYSSYSSYAAYPSPAYSTSQRPLAYHTTPLSVAEHPSPAQVGELYQPTSLSNGPLVPPPSHPSTHDTGAFPFSSQNGYSSYMPAYLPSPYPSSAIAPPSSSISPYPLLPENAVAGPSTPSGLTQHFSQTTLGGGSDHGRDAVSQPPPQPAENGFNSATANVHFASRSRSRPTSESSKGKARDVDVSEQSSSGGSETPSGSQQPQPPQPLPIPSKRRKDPKDVAARKYVCTECDQRFARPSALATHILTHTKEKPFICFTCQRGFAVMSNLRRHCRVRNHALAPSQEAAQRPRSLVNSSTYAPSNVVSPGRAERHSIDSNASSASSSAAGGGGGPSQPGSVEGTPAVIPLPLPSVLVPATTVEE
ncbi:hypothetical protein JCM8547_008541 [Rhodosporidiobolus lusitaniae]